MKQPSRQIIPPLLVLGDYSGKMFLRPPTVGSTRRVFVACAVSIDESQRSSLMSILPRSGDRLLKATDSEFSAERARQLCIDILNCTMMVSLLLIDPSTDQSISTAEFAAASANQERRWGRRQIKPFTLMYGMAMKDPIIGVWGQVSVPEGAPRSFFDVVFDSEDLRPDFKKELQLIFKNRWEKQGAAVETTWKTEQEERLLHFPDLLAGIAHRNVTKGGVPDAWRILCDARSSKRVRIQNGLSIAVGIGDDGKPMLKQLSGVSDILL